MGRSEQQIDKVGRYAVLSALGRGGMGRVYRVKDEGGKEFALKLLLPQGESTVEQVEQARRLRDESKAAGSLRHEAIVKVFDSGEDEALGPYVVYQLLSGNTLRDELDERKTIPKEELIPRLVAPILSGLAALHEAGVIHRDIKPENLFQGANGKYMIGDFGLARFEGREAKTKTGLIVGTPDYIAPEQLLKPHEPATESSDLYSFGLVLAEAWLGRKWSLKERLAKVPSLRGQGEWGEELSALLHPEPQRRPACANELLASLTESGDKELRTIGERTRARPLAAFVAGAVLLLIAVFGAWSLQDKVVDSQGEALALVMKEASTIKEKWPFVKRERAGRFVHSVEGLRSRLKNTPMSGHQRDEYWQKVRRALGPSKSMREFLKAARLGQVKIWQEAHRLWRNEVLVQQATKVGPVFGMERIFYKKVKTLQREHSEKEIHHARLFYLSLRAELANSDEGFLWMEKLFAATNDVIKGSKNEVAKEVFSTVYDLCKRKQAQSSSVEQLNSLFKGSSKRAKEAEQDIIQFQKAIYKLSDSGVAGRKDSYRRYFGEVGRAYWALIALLQFKNVDDRISLYAALARLLATFYNVRAAAGREKMFTEICWGPFLTTRDLQETFITVSINLASRLRWRGGKDRFSADEYVSIVHIAGLFEKVYKADRSSFRETVDTVVNCFPKDSVYRKYALAEAAFVVGELENVVLYSDPVVEEGIRAYEKMADDFVMWFLLYRAYTMRWYAMHLLKEQYASRMRKEARHVIAILRNKIRLGSSHQCYTYGAAVFVVATHLKENVRHSEFAEDVKRCTSGEIEHPYNAEIIKAIKGGNSDLTSLR